MQNGNSHKLKNESETSNSSEAPYALLTALKWMPACEHFSSPSLKFADSTVIQEALKCWHARKWLSGPSDCVISKCFNGEHKITTVTLSQTLTSFIRADFGPWKDWCVTIATLTLKVSLQPDPNARFMSVFSLLQQIYLLNKKEQQSAEIIKRSLLETLA